MHRVPNNQDRVQDRELQGTGAPAPLPAVRRDARLRRPAQPHLQALQIEPGLAPRLISQG